MITQATLDFLRGLKEHNDREWFQEHRADYDKAYGDFFDTVVRMVSAIASFDPAIEAARLDPKACIMRIYRDIRFSKDKTPYKTGFFAYVSSEGKKGPQAGYYLHVEPGQSFAGGGLYLPEPQILEKTRLAIDSQFPEWQAIVTGKELIAEFPKGVQPSGATKRPPKGYDAENPAIGFLRFKGYYTQRFYDDDTVMAPDFVETLTTACRAVMPMVRFLNRAIRES